MIFSVSYCGRLHVNFLVITRVPRIHLITSCPRSCQTSQAPTSFLKVLGIQKITAATVYPQIFFCLRFGWLCFNTSQQLFVGLCSVCRKNLIRVASGHTTDVSHILNFGKRNQTAVQRPGKNTETSSHLLAKTNTEDRQFVITQISISSSYSFQRILALFSGKRGFEQISNYHRFPSFESIYISLPPFSY